jgi:hypothetical protein
MLRRTEQDGISLFTALQRVFRQGVARSIDGSTTKVFRGNFELERSVLGDGLEHPDGFIGDLGTYLVSNLAWHGKVV